MNRALTALALVSSALVGTAAATPVGGPIHNEVRRVAPGPHTSDVVNSHVLYLNQCIGGCRVNVGATDARTHSSELANSTSNISPWPYSAAAWSSMVSCVRQTMSPFAITVTDTNPGNAEHFEVMIGGNSAQLNTNPPLSSNVGGVAPLPCSDLGVCEYIPNALVFDFPEIWGNGSTCDAGCVLNICSTASQEIGHAWTLDHVVDGTDPMSYNLQYNPVQPSFRDHQTCGSDCIGGQSPLQLSCSSNNNMTATHTCFSTDASTQDELSTILQLFGPSNAMPPTVAITSPSNHATVSAGFTVKATCSAASGDAVAQVQLLVDGAAGPVLTAAPFTFTAPSGLANGAHQVDVTCSTASQQQATATVNVTLGVGCSAAMTCPGANDVCLNGACIPGSGAAGGLGATCTKNADCDSMECATSSAGSFCVVPCDPNMPDVCPSSFGCDMAGATSVCFPNGDSGGGGCNSSSSGGTIVLGLGFAVLLVTRRRP